MEAPKRRTKKGFVMKKPEFVDAVVSQTGKSKKEVEEFIAAYQEVITNALKKGDEVAFVGFGTFSTVKKAARTGRNPQTGAELKIAASTAPKFKPGKALKDAVNK
jgi:DNA-binding protein HU-beta